MNNTDIEKRLGIEVRSAADAIYEAIEATPKMNRQDRRVVAQNMDDILRRAKREGVRLYEVAEHAGLGSRGEKNPKHLRPYRQPAEAKERMLNVKAQGYVNLIEALAGISGHSHSGATDDLLRQLFAGSGYGAPRGAGAELKVELKALIDDCVKWMDRHLELANSYTLLTRMGHERDYGQGKAAALYNAATMYCLQLDELSPPQLLLGTQYHVFLDAGGEEIVARDSDGNLSRVCYVRRMYLYAGPGDDGLVRPFLVVVPGLALRGETGVEPDRPIARIRDRDGAEFGALKLECFHGEGGEAVIEPVVVSRTVDLSAIKETDSDEYNPVLRAFVDANPDFGDQEFNQGEEHIVKEYEILPLTLDVFDSLERWLETADTSWGILAYEDLFPPSLRYGSSGLARLAGRFMEPRIVERGCPEIGELKENCKLLDGLAPPGGWMHPECHPYTWSATDIWWLRSKRFKTVIDSNFEGRSRNELAAYTDLMARFRHDSQENM